MAISVADNFSYLGGKPLDGRIQYDTVASMKAMADAKLYEGCEAYCIATDKYYKWNSTNTVDETLGKWREIESGGQTYNDFTGATDQADGVHGLVPAPQAGDEGKVLYGNGSWGNIVMPSVDYSQQSVEANIFDTTEKVIGQWIDGKLLYQKCLIPENDESGLDNNQWNIVLNNALGAGVVDKVITLRGVIYNGSKNQVFEQPDATSRYEYHKENDQIFVWVASDWAHRPDFILAQYTKTTDSPLASDEKFAGLTSSGEVIYKKHFYTAEIASGSFYDTLLTFDKIIKVEGYCEYYGGTTSQGLVTFPQYFGSSGYEGLSINVKSNMAKNKIVVYMKTTQNPEELKIKDVNFDVYYTKPTS